jgi:Tfp pilus assembly protein PilN
VTTLTATRAAQLPRVNLLPPEIAEAAKLARTKRLLVGIVVATLVLLGLGFFWASSQVSAAQSDLDAANAQNAALQAEAAQYAAVPEVEAELATAHINLATAMAPEVRVSFLMNDLSLTIPSQVRLTTMTIGVGPTDAAVQAATTAALAAGQPAPDIAGSVTYQGKSTSFDAMAAWLNSFNKQVAYANPYLTNGTQDTEATTVDTVYTFDSSAQLTAAAKSNRYTAEAGQ